MTAPTLAVPPSCHASALVLYPCTVLLLILAWWDIAQGKRARDPRVPHSFAASSCHARTRPPFGHDMACSVKNFLPQPLQVVGMSCGISPYLRQRLFRSFSQDNSMPLRQWGTALSHAPFLLALWRRFISCPSAISFLLARSAISTCFRSFLAPALSRRTHALWPT